MLDAAVAVGAGPLSLDEDTVAGVVEVARAGVFALLAEDDVAAAVDEAGVLLLTVEEVVLLGVAVLAGLVDVEEVVAGRAVPEDTDVLVLLAELPLTVELLAGLVVVEDVAGLVEVEGLAEVLAGRELAAAGRALEAGRAVVDD